jgi:phage terminase large subunit-like protein
VTLDRSSDGVALVSGLVLEDGRRWGEVALDRQVDDLRAVLNLSGRRYHFVTRPRGGSKTTDVAAAAVAVLALDAPPGSRSYAVAADADQARLLVDAMARLIARTPGLAGAFSVEARRVTATATGATLEALAADGPSAFGLLPHLVVMDELAVWPETDNARQVFDAMLSAVPKTPHGRLVIITSAGSPSHWSYRVLERARSSRAWRTSEMPGPCPWIDSATLAEQQALISEAQYARLFLNEWTEPEDRLARRDDLDACIRFTGPQPPIPGRRYVMSLDMAYVHDQAVVAICHRDPDGIVVVDVIEAWQGTPRNPVREADVEERLDELWRVYQRPSVWLDPWQTKGLAQRLRAGGATVVEYSFTSQSVGRLALTLYRLIRDHLLALPNDRELLDELAAVRLRETTAGTYRLDHAAGRHDDRAVAIALCAQALIERPPHATGRIIRPSYLRRASGFGAAGPLRFPETTPLPLPEPERPIWRVRQGANRRTRWR